MTQAYYRKFRPQVWGQVVGQDHIISTLRNALGQGRIVHAYLFSGPRGTGKTTTARIIAKAVNCLDDHKINRPCNQCEHCREIDQGRFLDLIEIDAASNTSVDDVRDLREKINFLPSRGRFKVYIIDEVHMLSNAAFNALLKTLEEPPAHAIFVLATTEVQKIPATVLSRCQLHEFRRIPLNFIQAILKEIADREGIKIEPSAITAIARQATGSMRDAVSLLDQLASTGSDITLEMTQQVLGTSTSQNILDLVNSLLEKDMGLGIKVINVALDSGSDPRQFGRQVVDTLRMILMVKMGNTDQIEISQDESELIKSFSEKFTLDYLLRCINFFDRASQSASVGWQPGLQLELAVSRSISSLRIDDEQDQIKAIGHPPKKFEPRMTSGNFGKKDNEPTHENKIKKNDEYHNNQAEKVTDDGPGKDAVEEHKDAKEFKTINTDGDFEKIHTHWNDIRAEAKKLSPETAALLNSTRNMELNEGRLTLRFSSPLLSSKMENGKNIEIAQKAITSVTGLTVDIVCRVAGRNESAVPDDLDLPRNGMVGTAISLGGKIIKKEP